MNVAIVAIIFSFVTVIVIAAIIADTKEKKMKLEAAIRMEEIRKGYAPGTYSRSFSSKSAYKAMRKEAKKQKTAFRDPDDRYSEKEERENLEKGIKDLEERIRNLDTIMKEKGRR